MLGRREVGPVLRLLRAVVPEPALARLERTHDWVARFAPVVGRVLRRRRVTAAHVATCRAPGQMEPPAPRLLALQAAGPAGLYRDVDVGVRHGVLIPG